MSHCKGISIANQKGGTGKTTTAINLGIGLAGIEVSLVNTMSREITLRSCLKKVKENYDYVLIDCMPSLGMLTINALAASDSVIIPAQGLSDVIEYIVMLNQAGPCRKRLGELLNISNEQMSQLLSDKNEDLWAVLLSGVTSSSTGDGDIVKVARSQLGNMGGEPYWRWYGFSSRVSWCGMVQKSQPVAGA